RSEHGRYLSSDTRAPACNHCGSARNSKQLGRRVVHGRYSPSVESPSAGSRVQVLGGAQSHRRRQEVFYITWGPSAPSAGAAVREDRRPSSLGLLWTEATQLTARTEHDLRDALSEQERRGLAY